MDEPAQERPRGDHHRSGAEHPPITQNHAGRPALGDHQVDHFPLDDLETVLRPQQRLYRLAVELTIRLGPRPAHRRPLAPVEDPELDAGAVRRHTHDPVERIDLADEMTLAEPTYGGVARHGTDGGKGLGD